jgi:hypothetical protein
MAPVLIGLIAVSACAAQAPPAPGPFVLISERAAVRAGLAMQGKAPRVAALLDREVPCIAAIVGTDDLRPIPVVIYADHQAMLKAAGLPIRSSIVALATLPAGTIHVDGAERLASIERVLPHEAAHVLIARAVGSALPAVPVWLNEGIAEYAAGTTASQADPVWLRAISKGKSLRLEELDNAIAQHGGNAGLAYAQAASLVNFLVAQRGEGVIADLLRSIATSRDFEESLRQVTGWRPAEMEAAWQTATARRWRWPLLFESQAVWFGLMVLLFLAGLARYLRQRRRRQEAPDEDW